MPWVGFKPTVPVSKRAKTVHALDRWATMTGVTHIYLSIFVTSVCLYACQPLLSVSLYIKYVLYLSVYLSNTEFSFSTPISFCYISINLSSFSSRLPVSICPPTYFTISLHSCLSSVYPLSFYLSRYKSALYLSSLYIHLYVYNNSQRNDLWKFRCKSLCLLYKLSIFFPLLLFLHVPLVSL